MMSIVVGILTAPINLIVDFLFVDILSAPSVDDAKLQRENNLNQSPLGRMMKKAGDTVRRASAVTASVVKVARRNFGVHKSQHSMQIPESTIEAHQLALASSQQIVEEHRSILDKEQSSRKESRSQVLLARQKRGTQYHLSEGKLKRTNDQSGEDEELNELFGEFVVDLNEQRRLLKPAARERYDSQWG
jgi:hypothetical protein